MIRRPPRSTLLSLHDALPICQSKSVEARLFAGPQIEKRLESLAPGLELVKDYGWLTRSEEHTSELQSQSNLVCRLLLEKKKINGRKSNLDYCITSSPAGPRSH